MSRPARPARPCVNDRLDRLERIAIALTAALDQDTRIGGLLRATYEPLIAALRSEYPSPRARDQVITRTRLPRPQPHADA